MAKVFEDYAGLNEKLLEGFTVTNVMLGVNAEETGLLMELEHEVDNVTLGIDVLYNPEHSEDETELMISSVYVKRIQ